MLQLTVDEVAERLLIEQSRLQREALMRLRRRRMREQHGELFYGLPRPGEVREGGHDDREEH